MAFRVDDSELDELERDLRRAQTKAQPAVNDNLGAPARLLRRLWRHNATRTAGAHGKHYPRSITAEEVTRGRWHVGPEVGRLQGSMGRGFEYGSVNQPPHLDGARALRTTLRRVRSAASEAADETTRPIRRG